MRLPRSSKVTSGGGPAEVGPSPARNAEGQPIWDTALGVSLRWSPLALALAVFLVWAALDGGYASVKWLPGTIFVLGLTVIVALGEGRPMAGRPVLAAASIFFAAFTAWSFLSIAWADVKGDAWDGANRTLLYLCVFVLFAWRPVPVRIGAVLLGAFVAATAAIGTIEFLHSRAGPPTRRILHPGTAEHPDQLSKCERRPFPGAFSPGGLPRFPT